MSKFKVYRQRDAMQCGVACLKMICAHYGIRCSLELLNNMCNVSTEGVSMLAIVKTSQALGFNSEGIKANVSVLSNEQLPVILYWNQNHFVVLYKIDKKGKRFWIADPGKGKYKCSLDEFQAHWLCNECFSERSGLYVSIKYEENETSFSNNHQGNKQTFLFISKYVVEYKKYFALILGGLLLGCILQLAMPFLTQWIVDFGIKNNDIKFIWLVLLGELMIVIGRVSMEFTRLWLLLHISMRINVSLVSDFFIKLLKLPMSFFDAKLTGDLLQRMNDHNRVQDFLTNQVLNIMFTLLTFSIFGIVLCIYNVTVFFIFISGSAIYGIWIYMFLNKRKVLDYESFEQQALNNNCTYQFITSMQEVKLQGCENRRRWEWEDVQADLFSVHLKTLKLQQSQEAGSIFINEMKNIFITVFAASAVIDGNLSFGAMLAIQYIVGQLNTPVEQFMQFIYSLQDVKLSLERINEIHLSNEENTECMNLRQFSKERSVIISNVNFKYDKFSPKFTLENVSFPIKEGKVTAIVGASGSGKTTLIKLLLGYYKPISGTITIAGCELNKYDVAWWRSRCGVVMQDGVIFSESIARNIAVDDGEIDELRLEKSARIASIHDYITSLPLKYATKIGPDGVGLSKGQRQRILIARAVYKNPDYIFLDEATNSLDAQNEKEIVKNLENFYKGKTVVIVAHRLSTVKNADSIIVMSDGKIVENGTHADLIKKNGYYYSLIKDQLELGHD